jgi:hypothetical protein
MLRLVAVALTLTTALAATRTAGADPPKIGRCGELKAAATAQRVSDLLDAYARNRARPDPPRLAAAISEAEATFAKGFAEAEAQGDCTGTGDAAALRKKSDDFVRNISVEASKLRASPGGGAATGQPGQGQPNEPPAND